jgi:uncharacterized protein involved in exopolysaccharide biosynthesis
MNPQKPRTPRQELEASLTALLLGELPAEKAAAIRELMAKDAELARLYERLEQTIGLVRETAGPAEQGTQSAPLKLSTKRREQLLQHFKTITPREFTKPERRKIAARELAIAAGFVALIGISAWLVFSLPQSFSSMSRIRQDDVQESGQRTTDLIENDMTEMAKARPQSSVSSIAEQPTARHAAEHSLEMMATYSSSASESLRGMGSPSQTIFDASSASKPIASQVVLPVISDYSPPAQSSSSLLTIEDSAISTSRSTGGFGRAGTGANWGSAEPQQQNDEMLRRQAGGLAWTDNMHQKNGNAGLADGAVQEMSRSKLQEGLKNSSVPMEKVPVIDPATGLPVPASGKLVNGAIDPATELPSRVEVAGAQKKMRVWNGAGDSNALFSAEDLSKRATSQAPLIAGGTGGGGAGVPATASAMRPRTLREPALAPAQPPTVTSPIAGEKLGEVAQEGKDVSGSNVYLGKELAKTDVKFGTWSLETGQPAAQPGGTKKEEEKLRQLGEGRDGVIIAGRAATPGLGFSLLGPKETPLPSTAPIDSQEVPLLGDLPTLGKAFKGTEAKPGQTTSAVESLPGDLALARGTNATRDRDAALLFEMGRLDEAQALFNEVAKEDPNDRAAQYYLNIIKDSRYKQPLSEKELVTRQSMVDIEKERLNPPQETLFDSTNPQAIKPSTRIRGDVAAIGGDVKLNDDSSSPNWSFQTGTSNRGSIEQAGEPKVTLNGITQFSNSFAFRLQEAAKGVPYDRYTEYRNLEQLGAEGDKETKLALNYSSVTDEDGKKASKLSANETNIILPAGVPTASQGASKVDALNVVGYYNVPNLAESNRAAISRQLSQSVADQEAKVRQAKADVERLREEYKIADAMAAADGPAMLMSAETLQKLEGMRIELEAQVTQQEAVLDKMKKMPRKELVAALPMATPDTQLNSLLEQKNYAEQALILKQKEVGESSPEAAKLRSQVSDLNSKIDKQTDGILAGLDGRVASVKEQLGKLRDEVEKAKTNDLASAKQTKPYWDAKRKLDDLERVSQVLAMKVASENIEASLPKSTMVEIMDDAVPVQAKKTDVWDRIRGKGKYESQARIKVERDQSEISSSTDSKQVAQYDPYFIQNEFETIQSDKVLGRVVTELNLQKEWAKGGQTLSTNQAIALLKQKLDLKPERNTSFIDIGVKSDKPAEAAELANAIARAYQGYRLELRRELSLGGIKDLEQRWNEQQVKIQEAQKQVDKLRAEAGINQAKAAASQPLTNQQVDAAPAKPAVPPPVPQPEVQTRENAFSTFSLNVSDVAFKLATASLEKLQMPEPASIRSEEFINAFDYRDPGAPAGVPVAFAWERARYPYAQNRDLLRFSIKTAAQGRQAGRPLNLVLLMDNSGSMERADRIAIIHEALKVLASQLQPQDKLSVITFARTAQLRVDGVPGNQATQVAEDIGGLTPEGGTNVEEAMNLAYQTALRHYLANGINRVVLLTDGAANLGNVEPESLKQKVEANRKQGVALDCFGIGWEGFNDDLLETLSRNGDGRYGFINSPEEAATEFVGQLAGALNVAASDVKVQVEFNPNRVTAYRQIGYAKHQLTKEQFRDNTVDAAEIAAQEAGNALYVVEVNPAGQGPLGTVRVRFKVPGTSDYHEHEWTVPFNGNAVALEQASPAMRLAATASAFSEWLASSPFATEVTPDTLLSYLSGVPEVYGVDGRPKKLEWMIRQAKSLAGK